MVWSGNPRRRVAGFQPVFPPSGRMPMVVCAAKSYLTQYGIPENPPI